MEDLLGLQIPITFYVDEKSVEMYVDDMYQTLPIINAAWSLPKGT